MRHLMDLIPTLDDRTSARRVAADVGCRRPTLAYLERWRDKALTLWLNMSGKAPHGTRGRSGR
jgi:hypothetical protein